jgi:hypothetical protein
MKGGVIPSSKEGNKSPDKDKKGAAARAKDKEDKHQGKQSQNSTQYNKGQENPESWKLTPELISHVMERSRHNIFRLFPENAVESIEHMVMKAVAAYEKEVSKRKQSASHEARKQSQQA